MQATIQTNAPVDFQPVTVTLTLESPDDVRWFYHLVNFQKDEIIKGYNGARNGNFSDRFVDFQVPDKKPLWQAIKEQAAAQNVQLKLSN